MGDMSGGAKVEDPSDDRLSHMVACSTTSGPRGTEDFEEIEAKAEKIRAYARRLGFGVTYENDARIGDS